MLEEYIKNIGNSLLMNYKSWIGVFISLYLINGFKQTALLTFIISMFLSHVIHYMLHYKYVYPHNIVHNYHHRHNYWFSHLIQMILEFVSILSVLFIKYLSVDFTTLFSFIDDWTVIFYYLFYTTIHNVNYSCFHVNRVHEIHHQVFFQNLGPDICDIIMGTKYRPEDGLENTDHYISNCIYCTSIVLLLQAFWNRSTINNKILYLFLSKCIFLGFIIFLAIATVVLYIQDIDDEFDSTISKAKAALNIE